MPKPIPYLDAADDTLLDRLSADKAARYLSRGIAYAIHDGNGRVLRLYRARSRGRAYSTAASSMVSGTTQRIRYADGALAPRPHVEQKPTPPPRWVDAPVVVVEKNAGGDNC
jgi:hypothetical protein